MKSLGFNFFIDHYILLQILYKIGNIFVQRILNQNQF